MGVVIVCLLLLQQLALSPWPAASAQELAAGQTFLSPHNAARSLVSVPPLTWNTTLVSFAQNYADAQRSANSCRLMQPSGGPYGENKFWGSSGKIWTGADAVASWVALGRFYNVSTNMCVPSTEPCGVYTQVVWRSTTSLGCASSVCGDNSTFIICSYYPPGNVRGQAPF